MVAHDLQSPLRQIRAYLDLYLYHYMSSINDKTKEWVNFIDNASKRMQNHIKALLTITKIDNMKHQHEVFSLDELVDKVLSIYTDEIIKYDISIVKNNCSEIKAVKVLTEILLQNLIENAIKFKKEGASQPEIKISLDVTDSFWKILVADNGLGIEEDLQVVIFEKFQKLTNNNSNTGNGLGLFISKRIVEIHNGFINLDSRPNEGSIFEINLPKIKKDHCFSSKDKEYV